MADMAKLAVTTAICLAVVTGCGAQTISTPSDVTVCQKPDGKHYGLPFGDKCDAADRPSRTRPDTGFLGFNAKGAINYDTAVLQSRHKTFIRKLESYPVVDGAWENFPPSLLAQLKPETLSEKALDGANYASHDWGGRTRNGAEDDINTSNRNKFIKESSRRAELFENSKEGKDLADKINAEEEKNRNKYLGEVASEADVDSARVGVIEDLKEVRRELVDKALKQGLSGPGVAREIKVIMKDSSISALMGAGASRAEAERGWKYISEGIDANINY